MIESSGLSLEWQALQHDHERYETSALHVKLAAVGLTFVALAVPVDLLLVAVLLAVLWLQEAILRTSQSRLGARLLYIEGLLRGEGLQRGEGAVAATAFQLHSGWHASRGGSSRLLAEYAAQAMRPTIAFPYVVLLAVLLAALAMPAA